MGELNQAEASLSLAIRYDPLMIDSYFARSDVYRLQGDTQRAEADLKEAMRCQSLRNHERPWRE